MNHLFRQINQKSYSSNTVKKTTKSMQKFALNTALLNGCKPINRETSKNQGLTAMLAHYLIM